MKIFLIQILLIFMNFSNVSSQTFIEDNYKHLVFRETPFSTIKGRIPLDKTQINSENHFEITSDQKGRIVQLRYCYGKQPIRLDRVGFMDGIGDLASIVKIQYIDNFETRTYFDISEIQTTNGRGVFKAVYEYNSKGQRIGLKYFDENDNPVNDSWDIFEYTWEHLNVNKILEKRKNIRGAYVPIRPFYKFMNVVYTYDDKGLLVSMENVDAHGELIEEETGTAIDKPIYDEDFNLTSFRFFNQQRKPIEGSFYNAAGGLIEYDSKGNMKKYTTIDLDGNNRAGAKDWAFIECAFDSKGNLIMERYFDENDMPAKRKGVIGIKYFYEEVDSLFKLKKTTISHF